MSQQELVARVIHALEEAGIEYMITGSLASSLQGEPRATHDMDVVVAVNPGCVQALLQAFPDADFYADEEAAEEAVIRQDMFNIIDLTSGDKVDFWMLTDEPFDLSRFARRYREVFLGMRAMVSSPEDTILAKLRWAELSGGSEKQFGDALGVFEVQFEKLDMVYLRDWAAKLGVEPSLERLLRDAEAAQ